MATVRRGLEACGRGGGGGCWHRAGVVRWRAGDGVGLCRPFYVHSNLTHEPTQANHQLTKSKIPHRQPTALIPALPALPHPPQLLQHTTPPTPHNRRPDTLPSLLCARASDPRTRCAYAPAVLASCEECTLTPRATACRSGMDVLIGCSLLEAGQSNVVRYSECTVAVVHSVRASRVHTSSTPGICTLGRPVVREVGGSNPPRD